MIVNCEKCGLPFVAKLSSEHRHPGRCPRGHKPRVARSVKLGGGKPTGLRLHPQHPRKSGAINRGRVISIDPERVTRRKQTGFARTPGERDRHYQKTYGITLAQYNEMLIAQDGRCAICGAVTARLLVDHCHTTGKVRGLLCGPCNTGLGLFRDSVGALTKAVQYLKRQ